MRGARGQTTIFVLIGLVLLIVVGLIFLTLSRSQQANTGTVSQELTQNRVLEQYVSSCLDRAVIDELRFIGDTGGLPTSDGSYPYAKMANTNGQLRDVLYGITRNRNIEPHRALKPTAYDPPRYPEWNVPIDKSDWDYDLTTPASARPTAARKFEPYQSGYFGDVWLLAACNATGPNAPFSTSPCGNYQGIPPTPLLVSIQHNLTQRLEANVARCVNISTFQSAVGRDVSAIGTPQVRVLLTDRQVIVNLTYGVTMRGQSAFTVAPFQRRYDVRLRSLLEFAHDVALEDTRAIGFDIGDPINGFKLRPSYRPGFNVSVMRNVVTQPSTPASLPQMNRNDLIIINDTNSILPDGTAFTLRFLRESRLPMIDGSLSESVARRYEANPNTYCDAEGTARSPDERRVKCIYQNGILWAYDEQDRTLNSCRRFIGGVQTTGSLASCLAMP